MIQKILLLCGMISPLLFIYLTIYGASLQPGYSHLSDTISELFSPGSPNKKVLDLLLTASAILTILFGFGVFQFVRNISSNDLTGITGAGMIITTGVINLATATLFPQDKWGTALTFAGRIHIVLVGILIVLTIVSILLIGIFIKQLNIYPGFGLYSFITVGVIILTGVFSVTQLGTSIMGLTERITALVCLQWIFIFAFKIFLSS